MHTYIHTHTQKAKLGQLLKPLTTDSTAQTDSKIVDASYDNGDYGSYVTKNTNTNSSKGMYVYACMCMYVCVCMYAYVCMYVCMYIPMYVCVYMCVI